MIVVRRHHELGLARAKRLAESIARQLQKDYGGSYAAWTGNDLHFGRPGASGSVAVTKDDFQVRIELGWLLSPLRGLFEREVHTFCDEHFGAAAGPDRRLRAQAGTRSKGDTRPPRARPRASPPGSPESTQ